MLPQEFERSAIYMFMVAGGCQRLGALALSAVHEPAHVADPAAGDLAPRAH